MDLIDTDWTNVVAYFAEGAVCIGGIIGALPTGGASTALCVPIFAHFSNDVIVPAIMQSNPVENFFTGTYGIDPNEYDETLDLTEDLGSYALGAVGVVGYIQGLSEPTLSVGSQAINNAQFVNDLSGFGTQTAIWGLDAVEVSPSQNDDGEIKATEVQEALYKGYEEDKPLDVSITRSSRPWLKFGDVAFDDPQNPAMLNVTVESSRYPYEPGTTSQTTPALRIGGEDFTTQQINEGSRPLTYEAQIPTSQLPGFSGDPDTWTEPITAAGASLETIFGDAQGGFSGIEVQVLELLEEPAGAPNAPKSSTAADPIATLDMPANTFGGEASFVDFSAATFSELSNPDQPSLRARSVVANIDAGGQVFSQPATLTLHLNQLAEDEEAAVYRRSTSGSWQVVGGTLDRSAGTATAEATLPGYYAVLTGGEGAGDPPADGIPVAAGETGLFPLGETGAVVEITENNDPDGGQLQFDRFDEKPPSSTFDGSSATAPDSSTVTPNTVAGRYYDITGEELTSVTFKVRLGVTGVPGIDDPNQLLVLKREDSGEPWLPLNTTRDGAMLVSANLTSFSEFTVGGDSTDNPLPVELTSFEAAPQEAGVLLTWKTASETGNDGFAIERQSGESGAWTRVGFREGAGTTTEAQTYRFEDADLPYEAGRLTYRLKQVDLDGNARYSEPISVELAAPEQFALHGSFPNPFGEKTTIRYELPRATDVRLSVYDVLGRRVAVLVNEKQEAGRKEIPFAAEDLASGTYFYRLEASGQVLTETMVLVR